MLIFSFPLRVQKVIQEGNAVSVEFLDIKNLFRNIPIGSIKDLAS